MSARVVHVASGREWRGGQRQVWLLAGQLRDKLSSVGWSQAVVTGAGSELARRLRADGVTVRPTPWRAGLDPRALAAVRRELRDGPTVLHAHDSHAVALAGLARLRLPVPLVATRRTIFPLRRRGFWQRADRVIAISGSVRDVLVGGGVPAGRIIVIPSAAAPLHVDGDADDGLSAFDLRTRLGLPPDAPIALTVAALTPEKSHETLVDAAAVLHDRKPRLHWVVVGEGHRRSAIEARIRRREIAKNVHLLGAVPEVSGLLAQATVFVVTSTSEGLCAAVLEALTRGLPVVATAAGGLPEALGDAGLLVPVNDAAAVAEAVEQVIDDDRLRSRIGASARCRAVAFDPRRMAERTLEVYRSVSPLH